MSVDDTRSSDAERARFFLGVAGWLGTFAIIFREGLGNFRPDGTVWLSLAMALLFLGCEGVIHARRRNLLRLLLLSACGAGAGAVLVNLVVGGSDPQSPRTTAGS